MVMGARKEAGREREHGNRGENEKTMQYGIGNESGNGDRSRDGHENGEGSGG